MFWDQLIMFSVGNIVLWLPYIFIGLILLNAALIYIYRLYFIGKKIKILDFLFANASFWVSVLELVAFKIAYAFYLSAGKYFVWSQTDFTRILLNSPLDSKVPGSWLTDIFLPLFKTNSGYYIFHAYTTYFLAVFVSLLVSIAFYFFLKLLNKYQKRFFYEGEVELGLICALASGWPGFLIFVPMCFLSVVIVSIYRGIFLKEAYTTLGIPFILAAFLTLAFGPSLVNLFNLGVYTVASHI